jgi:Tfp pilus assembly protein PilF
MAKRLHRSLSIATFTLSLALASGLSAADAQTRAPADQAPATTGPAEPPMSEAQRLERLFERLKSAPDVASARAAAERIERSFEKSGSDTADLLLQRAKQAMEAKEFGTALDLLDFVVTMRPDWAEAYHRRAIIHFLQKDEEAAMRDVRQTLAREPRHWQALAGLGALLRQMGQPKQAYRAYRAALEIYPLFGDLKETIEKMRPEMEGSPV